VFVATERDSLIFLDNDLELFIDGGDCYYAAGCRESVLA
jgi:hypothetical protein